MTPSMHVRSVSLVTASIVHLPVQTFSLRLPVIFNPTKRKSFKLVKHRNEKKTAWVSEINWRHTIALAMLHLADFFSGQKDQVCFFQPDATLITIRDKKASTLKFGEHWSILTRCGRNHITPEPVPVVLSANTPWLITSWSFTFWSKFSYFDGDPAI